jgi:hypothetical protein
MKPKITDVYCYYTGGGIYVYSARYGENYLYGSLDQTIDCIRGVRGEILFHDEDVCEFYGWLDEMNAFNPDVAPSNYDAYYVKPDEIEYPTWQEILDSLRNTANVPLGADDKLLYWNPDLTKRTCEE